MFYFSVRGVFFPFVVSVIFFSGRGSSVGGGGSSSAILGWGFVFVCFVVYLRFATCLFSSVLLFFLSVCRGLSFYFRDVCNFAFVFLLLCLCSCTGSEIGWEH